LRLSPPELGSLEIRLEVKDGAMTATIDADTQTARSALLDNLPALRDRLADQQVRVERFDVNVRDNSQGGANPQGDTQQRESWGDSRGRGERSESPRPTASVVAPRPTIDPRFGDGRINVVA
jgi:flagellar hook-length control protein FliK